MQKTKHLFLKLPVSAALLLLFFFLPGLLEVTWAQNDKSKKPKERLTSTQVEKEHSMLNKPAESQAKRTSDLTERVAPKL
ncbi:hypothetical protein MYX84_09485, partial [Acidobacteria bacterium AH-259-O06]|nr:hypothetical protein [Acidobacteria bacterium AH-259-O06]